MDGFEIVNPDVTLGRGKIQLKQGNKSLDFDLQCEDYTTIFSSATRKDYGADAVPKANYGIKYSMDPSINDDQKQSAIKEFLTFLTSEKTRPENYHAFWKVRPEVCRNDLILSGINCEDLKSFSLDLTDEKKITAFPCEIYHEYFYSFDRIYERKDDDTDPNVHRACFILKLDSAMNSYILNVQTSASPSKRLVTDKILTNEYIENEGDSSIPTIFFIRRIPF